MDMVIFKQSPVNLSFLLDLLTRDLLRGLLTTIVISWLTQPMAKL